MKLFGNQRGSASMGAFAVLLLMVAGIGMAMVASQHVQDTRSRASVSQTMATPIGQDKTPTDRASITVNSVRVEKQKSQRGSQEVLLPEESVNFIANITNSGTEYATASAVWKIEPTTRTSLLDWTGVSLFAPGTKDFTVNRILPVNMPFGSYTFTVRETANGTTSEKTTEFTVGASQSVPHGTTIPGFNDLP